VLPRAKGHPYSAAPARIDESDLQRVGLAVHNIVYPGHVHQKCNQLDDCQSS
jgi:hypothetical protein